MSRRQLAAFILLPCSMLLISALLDTGLCSPWCLLWFPVAAALLILAFWD